MNPNPRSWVDQVVGGCFSLLLGAAAIYFAVRLVEAVWLVLLVILGVIGLLGMALTVLRGRRQRW